MIVARKNYWLALILVLLLVAWLGSRHLSIPIWFDEYVSIYNAGGPPYGPFAPAEILERVRADDFQTPGHYLLLAVWSAFAGWSPFAGRALSLLCGLLAVAWTYRLGRDMVSPLAGMAAAVMLGTSALFANYLHEMRAYSLYALLAVFTVWVYWRLVSQRAEPGRRLQTALVLGIAGLFYTHYFASLTAIMIGLYHLLFAPKNLRWGRIFLLISIGGLLFLPWLSTVLEDLTMVGENPAKVRSLSLETGAAIQHILYFFSNGSVTLLALVGTYSLMHINRRARRLAWFWTLAVTGLALAVNAWTGALYAVRHLMGLWPALALLAGIGVDRLARAGVKPLFLLGLWTAAGIWMTVNPTAYGTLRQLYAHLHWDRLAEALRPRVQPDDTVIYLLPYPADPPLHEIVAQHYLQGLPGDYHMLVSPRLIGALEFAQQAGQITSSAGRLWIGYDTDQPPDYLFDLDTVLINNHVVCGTAADEPGLHLNVYAPLATDQSPTFRYGEEIVLTLLSPLPENAHNTLNVLLAQNLSDSINPSLYSVALHLENEEDQLVAQADYGLSNESFACHATDIPVRMLPKGVYNLWLIVYEWQTGIQLTGKKAQMGEPGERLLLATVTIKSNDPASEIGRAHV